MIFKMLFLLFVLQWNILIVSHQNYFDSSDHSDYHLVRTWLSLRLFRFFRSFWLSSCHRCELTTSSNVIEIIVRWAKSRIKILDNHYVIVLDNNNLYTKWLLWGERRAQSKYQVEAQLMEDWSIAIIAWSVAPSTNDCGVSQHPQTGEKFFPFCGGSFRKTFQELIGRSSLFCFFWKPKPLI